MLNNSDNIVVIYTRMAPVPEQPEMTSKIDNENTFGFLLKHLFDVLCINRQEAEPYGKPGMG